LKRAIPAIYRDAVFHCVLLGRAHHSGLRRAPRGASPGADCSLIADQRPEEQAIVYATHFAPALDLFNQKHDGVAWRSKPSSSIVASEDRTVHPDLERFAAKRMGAKTVELCSSHVPMLSHPGAVLDVIRDAAAVAAKGPRAAAGRSCSARPGFCPAGRRRRIGPSRSRPTEYAQHLRIERARDLLQFTRRPVDQIAWTVGYEDPAAFRRLFRRIVGLSAGEYRSRFTASTVAALAA
jgi:hypothetical protein